MAFDFSLLNYGNGTEIQADLLGKMKEKEKTTRKRFLSIYDGRYECNHQSMVVNVILYDFCNTLFNGVVHKGIRRNPSITNSKGPFPKKVRIWWLCQLLSTLH